MPPRAPEAPHSVLSAACIAPACDESHFKANSHLPCARRVRGSVAGLQGYHGMAARTFKSPHTHCCARHFAPRRAQLLPRGVAVSRLLICVRLNVGLARPHCM
jgi:hypothetical protein